MGADESQTRPRLPVHGNRSWLPSRIAIRNSASITPDANFSSVPGLSPGDSVADGEIRQTSHLACDSQRVRLSRGTLPKRGEEDRMMSQKNISASTPVGRD